MLDDYPQYIKDLHADYKIKRVYSKDDYIELVKLLAVKFGHPRPLKDAPNGMFFLRHDVDRDIINAVLMAEIEHELGIQSTYFFLHTSAYYRQGVFDEIQKIADLGHEIGLHNDVLSVYHAARSTNLTWPKRILADVLNELRERFEVVGTSSHGNTEMFKKTKEPNTNLFIDPRYDCRMEEYGLKYEAYSISRDYYISDSGGKFSCTFGEGFGETDGVYGVKTEIDRIKHMSFKRPGVLQLLVHPLYYRLEDDRLLPR